MSGPDAAVVRRRARVSRETVLVLGVAAALAALAALCSLTFGDRALLANDLELGWWVFVLAFAATEAVVLHIQIRREAQSVSLSELPLVLGLFFASPWHLLVGRLIGSAVIFVVRRRQSPLKTTFNLALVAAETGVAVVIFSSVNAWVTAWMGDDVAWGAWIGAYAAALLANCFGALAIGVVISVYEGDLDVRRLFREAVTGQPAAPMVVTFALVAVSSLAYAVLSTWLLVGCAVALLLSYRAYASLSDRHLSLERLYRFSQAVTGTPGVDQVLHSVLAEAKELLRSEHAEIAFVAGGGGIAWVRLGASGRLSRSEGTRRPQDAWLLRTVMDGGAAVRMARGTREERERSWLDEASAREALAVPLKGTAGVIGVILVTDRLGEVRTYDDDDTLLLETVANHASIALQNGELVDKLRHDALHDALTGLLNRVGIQQRLATVLDDLHDGRTPGAAVMILDLDGFKDVNDTLGHHQGDAVLVEVAARLEAAVGKDGVVARLGGDEFAVLLPTTSQEEGASRVGRRILAALEEPMHLDGTEVEIGGSLGIALAPLHATDSTTLLKRADVAMYDAKASTRTLRLYEPDIDTANPRRLTIVSELRAALQHGDVTVHVQPKALLATGEVTGVEALVRWEHPELGRVSPDEFIPVAERAGLIGALTNHVLDASLRACAGWRSRGLELSVAVNLSARSLREADLVEDVARALRRHGVPGHLLTLEITEGSVMSDPTRALAILHDLRDLGVRLSVDDFGTGYSSLSYLQRLPVQEVKIDRSFVRDLQHGTDDLAIVRSIVDLGRHLGLQVVAEGIENADTWELLRSVGCHLGQGWYLGRPMPIDELDAWLGARVPTPRRLHAVGTDRRPDPAAGATARGERPAGPTQRPW